MILVFVSSPTRSGTASTTARLGGNGSGSINVFGKEKNGCFLYIANLGKHIVGIKSDILVNDLPRVRFGSPRFLRLRLGSTAHSYPLTKSKLSRCNLAEDA